MDSYGLPNMGCAASTERSDGETNPRRVPEGNDTSNHPPLLVRPLHGMNRGFQPRNQGFDMPIPPRRQWPGLHFLPQNDYILPYQTPIPGALRLPPPPIVQTNRRYNIHWEERDHTIEDDHPFENNYTVDIEHYKLQQIPEETGLPAIMNASRQVDIISVTCTVCLDDFRGQDLVEKNFPYRCENGCMHIICVTCLRDWFIDACRNESKMPPRCCSTVPLSAIAHLLTKDQISLYKAKFEEWRTPDRFYCPVPTCSAFIPPRLLKKEGSSQIPASQVSSKHLSSFSDESLQSGEKTTSEQSPCFLDVDGKLIHSDPPTSAITCPKCSVSICTHCRQLKHQDTPCLQTDIDPLLAAQLEKWIIKRCPKCRAGVRRMFGCTHIECRCGAHFCFACLKPINECEGQCEEDEDDELDDGSDEDIDPEDIDGVMALNGTAMNLGEEPYNPIVDTWSCPHNFRPIYRHGGQLANSWIPNQEQHGDRHLDCQVCWKVLQPQEPPASNKNLEYSNTRPNLSHGTLTEPAWPMTLNGEPAWMCIAKHIYCLRCPKELMLNTETSKYRCACSRCSKCKDDVIRENKQVAKEEQNKEKDIAYDCVCGMIICGTCKAGLELGDE